MPIRSRLFVRTVAVTALVCSSAIAFSPPLLDEDEAQFVQDVRVFNDHLVTLANPFMEGRVPGSRGMEIAKEYFEHYLRQAGTKPAFENGTSYRQPFPLGGTVEVVGQHLEGEVGGATLAFRAGSDRDYTATTMGSSERASGPVVFVGYSIETGPDGFSSYGEDDDLSGKIAVMFRFEPMNEEGESLWGGRPWSPASGFAGKVAAAERRGAEGVVIINTPGADDPRVGALMTVVGGVGADIPVMMMSPEAAAKLVKRMDPEGRSLMELRRHADAGKGVIELDGELTIEAEISRDSLTAENVGGLIPGRGNLKDEYIVIGGHLDHLGMGYFGSRSGPGELHPGADDNASGSAAVLMLADKLKRSYDELPETANLRSIVLIGFSAEESGLNGSRYYVSNPIAPITDHDLMINFDMIGRIVNKRLSVIGTDSAEGLRDWLQPFFDACELDEVTNAPPGGSDHLPFMQRGVPYLFSIIADFHSDYHTPRDVSWKINREDAVRTVELYHAIALAAAQRPERLQFKAPEPRGNRGGDRANRGPGRINVRFGIQPGYVEGEQAGIPVEGVTPGSPAEKAGLKDGDRIVSWNDEKVASVEDWMPMLVESKPGDVVRVGIVRGGTDMTLKVTLEAR